MQSCARNITTVRYLLDLYEPTSWPHPYGALWQQPFMPTDPGARAQSLQALKHRLRKAWKSISPSTLQNLIGSMPNRLKAVIKNNGDTIPY